MDGPDQKKVGKVNFLDTESWLEAVDQKHRYGKLLLCYFRHYQRKRRTDQREEDFFVWLDYGEGRAIDLPWCPRSKLMKSTVAFLDEQQRKAWQVVMSGDGHLQWKADGELVHTKLGRTGSALLKCCGTFSHSDVWIFVLTTNGELYVGKKIKGRFHHSSFTCGSPALAAGNIHVEQGVVKRISMRSGHYRPDYDISVNGLNRYFPIIMETCALSTNG